MKPTIDSIRVLHVDDEPDFADVTADMLEGADERFQVYSTTSVDEGIEYLAENRIDCVISDYDMPGQNGIEFLETVREDYPDLPFILFTGKGSEEVASAAISAGVTDYLQKEVGADQYTILANRVSNSVAGKRGERIRQRQLDAIETAQEGISILDEDGHFIYLNEAFSDIYGYEPNELVGNHWELLYRAEDAEELRDAILPKVEETGHWHGETIGLRADGSTFIEDHTLSTTNGGGLVCTVRDVTDHRERDRRLDETSRLLNDVLDAIDAAIWVRDAEGRYLMMNRRDRDLLGLGDQDVAGKTPEALLPTELAEQFQEQAQKVWKAEETVEFEEEVETAEGKKTFLIRETPLADGDDEVYAYCAIATDISERKDRELTLERYKTLVDNVGDAMYILDTDGYVEMTNDAMDAVLDTPPRSVVGTHASDVLADGDYERCTEVIRDLLGDSGRGWATVEATAVTESDDHIPVEINVAPLVTDSGEFKGSVGVVRDVSERKERERKLERYRHLVNAIDDPICTYDEAGRYDIVNRELAKRYDTTPDDLRGRPSKLIRDLRSAAEGDRYQELLDGEREEILTERESPSLGPGVIMEYRFAPLVIEGSREGAVAISRDITERKERHRELERTNDRLEEFANVISHDLRNPLNVAFGRLKMAQKEADADSLDDVKQALDRMDTLITDILTLARNGETVESVESVDLATMAENSWQNVGTGDATLHTATDQLIRADPRRLKQLLENLFRNAVEHGGEDVVVTVGRCNDGFYVEDDGRGIPEGSREKVFQSGYSTEKSGTGFGLAIVEGIVESHDWAITATAADSGGARFEISGVEPGNH